MTKNPVSLDKWRDYFTTANSDIFSIIEHAIMVAASDFPYDFKLKRDRIAERLFTCRMTKCLGCNRAEVCVGYDDCLKETGGDGKDSKGNKVSREEEEDGDDHREVMEMNAENRARDQDYDDAEALTDEIEEESQLLEEVARIKEVLDEREGKSDEVLFESLRRLQLMPLSVEILKATEIGKSVNALRKHGSKEIRDLVRRLVEDWKLMVDAWVNATTAIAGADCTTESAKTSGVEEEEEEEGLPSPPLDEGAFLATPTSMEWSQFFDGMDDDGNLQNCGEFNKNPKNGRTRIPERSDIPTQKSESPNDSRTPPKDLKAGNRRNKESTTKKESPPCKPNTPARPKPPSNETGTRRPNPTAQPNGNYIFKAHQNGTIQKKPSPQQETNRVNEASHKMKLEVAKRKLHERYQEAENAKKQRTIQVVELCDLPKQNLARGNQHTRPGNHHRQWAQGRW
ncbi:probable mediator of RNA polymerase II transcription subunit 26b isoform X2 [Salvia miltiorrhiza]|uniref:probable mediator of RNA polymerase II transcription subunit 26b isoform X2 n=1 Tax=Salvia miltiorrhiza TaxID=226208 RepID=UPI0025ABA2E2|nr:probable mediator of RNA polymerase II transcription subunit 26b isoform X2 [Salvia miltiorrhiza]